MTLNPGALGFLFAHLIENASRANSGQEGASASTVLDRDFRSVGLPDVVNQLNGHVGLVCDPGPFSRDPANGVVVVLGDGVGADERVNDDHVQLESLRSIQHPLDVWSEDRCAGWGLFSDQQGHFPAATDEKPILQVNRAQIILEASRADPAFGFLHWVLAVPVGDLEPSIRPHAQQGLAGRHGHALDTDKRGLADAAGGEGRGYELADVVAAVEPLPAGQGGRIAPDERADPCVQGRVQGFGRGVHVAIAGLNSSQRGSRGFGLPPRLDFRISHAGRQLEGGDAV